MTRTRTALLTRVVGAILAVAVVGPAGTAFAQKGGKPDTGLGTSTAARKYLEGRWGLISFDVFPPGKPAVHVGAQGSLSYDGFGNLQGEVRVPPDVSDPLRLAGVPNDNGRLSMSGRVVIDVQNHTLTYVVQGQQPGARSGPLSLDKKRHWVVEGNVLTLTTKDSAGKDLSVSKWQKLP